jgi:hypothetical protein
MILDDLDIIDRITAKLEKMSSEDLLVFYNEHFNEDKASISHIGNGIFQLTKQSPRKERTNVL